MRDFIRFAYNSTDSRVPLGAALMIFGLGVFLVIASIAAVVLINQLTHDWAGPFVVVACVWAGISFAVGYLLVEDARKG